jgi:hypothetical protein
MQATLVVKMKAERGPQLRKGRRLLLYNIQNLKCKVKQTLLESKEPGKK